ncbi:hypothetical protein [Polaribacter sp. Hel_I_88]|uniref:hypothetical protein n=1 Tax=Polaribacter sp. Hel_I_88 TaxID=1250006 RepID=UPI000AA7C9F0|nr:hypothetical protein [Polaribacter sp. Hel_I_88]
MRKIIKPLLLLTSLLIIYSCNPEIDIFGGNEHFKFSSSDEIYLFKDYNKVGEIRQFINENNRIVNFEIERYKIEKESSGFLSPAKMYYYDNLVIILKLTEINSEVCNKIIISISKSKEGKLGNSISIPSSTENSCGGIKFQYKIPEPIEYEINEMKIGNITYESVLTFEGKGGLINYLSFFEKSEVNKVYFDLKKGIIGFDDSESNTKFRIMN